MDVIRRRRVVSAGQVGSKKAFHMKARGSSTDSSDSSTAAITSSSAPERPVITQLRANNVQIMHSLSDSTSEATEESSRRLISTDVHQASLPLSTTVVCAAIRRDSELTDLRKGY